MLMTEVAQQGSRREEAVGKKHLSIFPEKSLFDVFFCFHLLHNTIMEKGIIPTALSDLFNVNFTLEHFQPFLVHFIS